MSPRDAKEAEANAGYLGDVESGFSSGPSTENCEVDPWAIVELVDDSSKWSEMTLKEKTKRIFINVAKAIGSLACLYFFVCSLDLLSSAFRLLGGRTTGELFSSGLLSNPFVGLMIGVLVTVLVQSSSTSTSIIVSMVGANIIKVPEAIPIIMGSNIGSSVTNTLVSFTQMGNRNEFRRAFAAATVHDMFNWLTVFVLFTLEIVLRNTVGAGYLEFVTGEIVKGINSTSGPGEIKILTVITEPFTNLIVQLDKNVLNQWALNNSEYENASLIRKDCKFENEWGNGTTLGPCSFLFADTALSDAAVGGILLALSLVMLCGCLIVLVKILNSLMKGHIANLIKRMVNANIPYVPWLTGYLAMLFGAVMTFVVQSSSVFTSTLTPLVGVGLITVERVYPLTLGSNIGTTTTSLLAALATDASTLSNTLQISLCHLFFNVTGILLFYPIPFMRFPIPLSKFLGEVTSKYRWFSIAYLVGMFLLLPGIVFGLSLAGNVALYCVLGPLVAIIVIVAIISVIQRKRPDWLPATLRNWKFLPKWMRSLEPLDGLVSRLSCCNSCQKAGTDAENDNSSISSDLEKGPSEKARQEMAIDVSNGHQGINNLSYNE